MHRLVEPRHRRHDGRAHLEHVGGQDLDLLGEIDLRAERDREEHAAGVLVGMRQRQERQEHLVAEPDRLQQLHRAVAVGEDVAVRRHHALGQAAGARGVDEAGDIGARDVARPSFRPHRRRPRPAPSPRPRDGSRRATAVPAGAARSRSASRPTRPAPSPAGSAAPAPRSRRWRSARRCSTGCDDGRPRCWWCRPGP